MKVDKDLHDKPITLLAYNHYLGYAVSFSEGIAEIWDPETFSLPSWIEWMSDTDLYELVEK
jgi:hypothetical protein